MSVYLDLATFEDGTHPAGTIDEDTWAWMIEQERLIHEMEMDCERRASEHSQGFFHGGGGYEY